MAPGGRKKGARPPFKEARMAKAAARKQRAALSAAQLFDRAQQALALDVSGCRAHGQGLGFLGWQRMSMGPATGSAQGSLKP